MKQYKKSSLILLMLVFVSLTACQKKAKSKSSAGQAPGTPSPSTTQNPTLPPSPTTTTVNPRTGRPESFTIQSVAQEVPNVYLAALQWELDLDATRNWVIQRSNEREGSLILTNLSPNQMQFVDVRVTPGEKYRYAIGRIEDGRFVERAVQSVTLPIDLIVANEQSLTEIKRFNRVYLTRDAVLRTNGNEFNLTAMEIHSDGGTIQSFPEKSSAAMGIDGKNAEPITIRVKRASGSLRILAKGLDGGTGLPGLPGATGVQGPLGALWGLASIWPAGHSSNIEATVRARNTHPHDEIWKAVYYCSNPGQSHGGIGGPGYPGGAGYRGGRGGNTPKVFIQIEDTTSFDVQFTTVAGKGGVGGAEGAGGAGGPGGPGNWDPHHICPQPQSGPQGPQGPRGPAGVDGENGLVAPICLLRNGKAEGNCDAFAK